MGGSTDSLRLAVVGLGRMGQLHLRTLQRLPGVSVVALIDVDHHKTDFASLHGIPFLTSCKELIGRVDAAVIATPAHEHLVSTLPLLEAGIHCLVEKPLATSMPDLDKLGAAAVRRGVLLAVGHSERFNAGVLEAKAAIDQDTRSIHVLRKHLALTRHEIDIDVVHDLMVHDLDWIVDAVGELPIDLQVIEAHQIEGRLEAASCKLFFSNGLEVVLEVNRAASARQRAIVLNNGKSRLIISLDQPRGPEPDALTKQAEAFIGAVRGAQAPIATWGEARNVMELVIRIRHECAARIDASRRTALIV